MEAHAGRNPPGLRPSPNTPSDVSCSSGPCSVVSTRETSPASSTHYPLETTSAARELMMSCPDHAAAAELPPPSRDLSRPRPDMSRPRPGLRAEFPSQLEMNPNAFQSVNERRSKLAVDTPRASHTSPTTTSEGDIVGHRHHTTPFRRSIAPIAPPHPSSTLPPSSAVHRGLTISNWRSSTSSLDGLIAPSPTSTSTATSCPPRDTSFRPLAHTSSSSNLLPSPTVSTDSRNSRRLLGHNNFASVAGLGSNRPSSAYYHNTQQFEHQKSDRNSVKMHPQTGKIIADADMDRAMSYCYDRGGGQYTRLVPVDLLPVDIRDMPRRVNTDEGMIVLPIPRQPGPDGQVADIQLETQPVVTPPTSPSGVATDNIQSRIDSIVNASPGPGSGPLVLSTRGFDGTTPTRALALHAGPGSGRREKIYCDKWIHDGTCAFTQQGCKYKHEMPHDRETQEKLGLFHGYPAWWKKQAVDQQRPLAIDDRPVSLTAGRAGFGSLGASASMGSGLSTAVVSSNWRAGPGHVSDTSIQGSPSTPSPTGGSGGSGGLVTRSGSIGFGGTGRGNARQVRTFASFQPPAPSYGPIGPPSRAGVSGSGSGSLTGTPLTTRSTRALTASSAASNGDDDVIGGGNHHGGAPYGQPQRSAFDTANPFAPLGDIGQSSSARAVRGTRRDETSSNDTTADGDEEQRGAPL